MKASQRVFVNTIAQYGRTIINMVLSLYAVRLVLQTLGQSDYGLYSLIAGVVAMLSFITNSLASTTQRFVSFYQGAGDKQKVKDVFNNSLLIHIFLGIIITVILELITSLLFNGFLNIPIDRIDAAKTVYQTVVVLLLVSFLTTPYRALLTARENIIYISIVDVIDGFLKVALVVLMTHVEYDKLVLYSYIMLFIQIVNFLFLSLYCHCKYEECCLPNILGFNKNYAKQLMSFAGWSIYGTGCTIGRQQGIAIALNKMMGPVVNAAYGIGFQVAGYTYFLSAALTNAISPQIIKAEGAGDRQKALWLSKVTCKMIFMLMSAICIPCMFEITPILEWWLDEVPDYSSLFCIMVMCTLLSDAISLGLKHINEAIGKIGLYNLVLNTPKLLTLPIVIIALMLGCSLYIVAVLYVSIEFICACARVYLIHKTAGLKVSIFLRDVILRELPSLLICILASWLCVHFISLPYRFLITFVVVVPTYIFSAYYISLTKDEKVIINDVINTIKRKILRQC